MNKDDQKKGGFLGNIIRTMRKDIERVAQEKGGRPAVGSEKTNEGEKREIALEEIKKMGEAGAAEEKEMVRKIRREAILKRVDEGKKEKAIFSAKPKAQPKQTKQLLEQKKIGLEKELQALLPQKKQLEEKRAALSIETGRLREEIKPILKEEAEIEEKKRAAEEKEKKTFALKEKRGLEKERWDIEGERRIIETERWEVEEKIATLERETSQSEIDYQKLLTREKDLNNELTKTSATIEKIDVEARIKEIEEKVAPLGEKIEESSKERRKIQRELDELMKQEKDIEDKIKTMEEEEKITTAEEKRKIESERWETERQRRSVEKSRWEIEENRGVVESELKKFQSEYQVLLEEEEMLDKRLEELNAILEKSGAVSLPADENTQIAEEEVKEEPPKEVSPFPTSFPAARPLEEKTAVFESFEDIGKKILEEETKEKTREIEETDKKEAMEIPGTKETKTTEEIVLEENEIAQDMAKAPFSFRKILTILLLALIPLLFGFFLYWYFYIRP